MSKDCLDANRNFHIQEEEERLEIMRDLMKRDETNSMEQTLDHISFGIIY